MEEDILRSLIERADGNFPTPKKPLQATIPPAREDLDHLYLTLVRNEKLLRSVNEQVQEQQKLIEELSKQGKLPESLKIRIDPEEMHKELIRLTEQLKKDIEELRKQVEAGKK